MRIFILIITLILINGHASTLDTLAINQETKTVIAPEGIRYQWYVNGVKIQGANNREFAVNTTGTYEVEVYSLKSDTLKLASTLTLNATGAIVKIYIIGDSTVCNYAASAYPQTGWGQHLGLYLNSTNISINNQAIGGRSSRSFYKQGRWDPIKTALVAGDYVFIQFGHNDRDYTDTSRYTSVADYKTYLTLYCNDAKAKGAIPVLVSPMVMNAWTGTTMRNVFTETGNNYRGAMQEVATALNVAFIDLNMKSWNYYKTFSAAYNARFFYKGFVAGEYANYPAGITDGTHFQEMGSLTHCRMIIEGIKELSTRNDMSVLNSNINTLYNVNISVSPSSGSDSMTTKSGTFPAGATITLKTIPKATKVFQKWQDGTATQTATSTLTSILLSNYPRSFEAIYQNGTICSATIITNGVTSICTGTSLNLSTASNTSYIWQKNGSTVATTQSYSATTTGSYTVTTTNAQGCVATSAPLIITQTTGTLWYADTDADGKGDPNTKVTSCTQPTGYVADNTDLCPTDANKTAPGNCGCGKTETSCVDCNNTVNGTATLDNCERCIGGTTGKSACTSAAEAETEACSYEGIIESTNAGYKGTGYINVPNAIGAKIGFTINANTAGTYTLSFRYANGSANDRPATVTVNGTALASALSFVNTTAFTTYKSVDVQVTLKAGNNTVDLSAITAEGLANIDQIIYVSAGISKGACVVTDLNSQLEQSGIEIFPNPFTNTFTINNLEDYYFELKDAQNRLIEKGFVHTNTELGNSLKNGIYFLTIKNKFITKTLKIVKESF
ncbi:MAG: GDSL-type esterase/lipase family protein [Cytophagales bacterium]